jgi:hypothetical protein
VDDTPKQLCDLSIQNVTVRSTSNKRFTIPITIEIDNHTENAKALIDSGAEGLFIDETYARKWRKEPLKRQIRVRNVDGTLNSNGEIKEKCLITFRCDDKPMTEWFYVTSTGDQSLILGLPWLEKRNPIIDWKDKTLEIPTSLGDNGRTSLGKRAAATIAQIDAETSVMEEDLVVRYLSRNGRPSPRITEMVWEDDDLDSLQWKEEIFEVLVGKFTMAQKIDQKYRKPEEEVKLPPEYAQWETVFER